MKKNNFVVFVTALLLMIMQLSLSAQFEVHQQLILHHVGIPKNEEEQALWNQHIRESIHALNRYLIDKGYVSPAKKGEERKYAQKNRAYFTRTDDTFSIYTIHIPQSVDKKICIAFLRSYFAQKNMPVHIDEEKVIPLSVPSGPSILNGFGLTFDELESLRAGTLKTQIQTQIDALQKTNQSQNKNELVTAQKKASVLDEAKEQLFWHQTFPTTGLRKSDRWFPVTYPFVPHFFTLWQLAPRQGAAVKVADIDTGVAAFTLDGSEKVVKNRDLSMLLDSKHSYNIVSENGLDPVDQLAELIIPYLDPQKFSFADLIDQIPAWVFEHHEKKTTTGLENYLKKFGLPELLNSDGSLTQKGQQAINDFAQGDFGITAKAGYFTIGTLQEPTSQTVLKQLLPLTPIASAQPLAGFLSHGSHTFGLIAGQLDNAATLETDKGIVGLAPKSDIFMIKAFRDDTLGSDKSTLIAALKKSIRYNADVVNMSLKVGDTLDLTTSSTALFKRIVCHIPYVVAASGNNGDPNFPNYAGKTVGYPARFPMVPFSVGAFGFDNGVPFIASFSQYEPNVGPKFVAPGVNILSAGMLPGQTVDSAYLFLDGTSMAAPIMSGFVALMLGEFKNDFTRVQLIKTCYRCCVKLANTQDWKEKVILGALDMRTALFTLHILKALKSSATIKDFDGQFEKLLLSVHTLLFDPCAIFGAQFLNNISFQNDMVAYIDAAQKAKPSLSQYYTPRSDSQKDVDAAIRFYVSIIEYLLGDGKGTKPSQIPDATLKKVAEILQQESVTLFADINPEARKVLEVFDTGHPYWQQKAAALQQEVIKKD